MSVSIEVLLKSGAILPQYATDGSSGVDVHANIDTEFIINPGERALIPSGVSISVPHGYEIQVRPRSGLAWKNGITVLNTPGTIDSDYRGEIGIILINHGTKPFIVHSQDRIAQLVVCPVIIAQWNKVNSLSETNRGKGGFGHTGV